MDGNRPSQTGVVSVRKLRFLLLPPVVFLLELLDASGSINELLLAGVEGVADGADFDRDLRQRAPGLESIAATTNNGGVDVIGVNAFFHDFVTASWVLGRGKYTAREIHCKSAEDRIE